MKERPINLKAWEVQAIRDGRKTQFRRAVKHQERSWKFWRSFPTDHGDRFAFRCNITTHDLKCPFGEAGDRLWVRETWQFCDYDGPGGDPKTDAVFRADGETDDKRSGWKPSIYMPRWASRITLEVVSVRVERLDEISEGDAIAEGVERLANAPKFFHGYGKKGPNWHRTARESFESAWQSNNGPGSWGDQWVWVVEFKQCK